jgi:hypothetical protein
LIPLTEGGAGFDFLARGDVFDFMGTGFRAGM